MNNKALWFGILSISALAICLLGCVAAGFAIRFAPDLYQFSLRERSLKVGVAAPDFDLSSLDGRTIRLSEFKGSPVVLIFAASWCPECRAEAPLLQELHESHPDLTILLVDSNEDDAAIRNFAAEFGMTHPVLLDKDGKVSDRYRIYAIPTGFFLDSDGVIRAMFIEGVTPKLLADKLPLIGVTP